MELRDYLALIKRSLALVLGLTLIFGLGSLVWAMRQPIRYKATTTVLVDKPTPNTATDYQYDKFYALQSSGLYADSLAAMLGSAGTVKEIYQAAGVPLPTESSERLAKLFTVRKVPASLVVFSFTDKDRANAEKIVSSATTVLEKKAAEQRRDDDPQQYFTVSHDTVVTSPAKVSVPLSTLAGLLAGFILSVILAFLNAYLKEK